MTLKQIFERLTRNQDPGITFEEFEQQMSDWAWNEYDRQHESVVGKVRNIYDRDIEGF